MLVLMFGGVIVGSKFGLMYAEIEKQRRINMPEEQQSGKDIHLDRHHTTHSSDSNDE